MSRIARTAAALVAAGLAGLVPAGAAFAHGATTQPISRTAACAQNGEDTLSAACKAALKANGGGFGTFDNLRVPDVNGRDRQVIPDGKLCSGGLSAFKGLDLPRTDYPSTTLTAGGTINVQYRTTIPHEGSFRVYLTKPGYDPSKALTWSDIPTKPFLTADNPPIRDGAYRMSGKLPPDRTGRNIVYVIWQTTSTPDTYYSCSDVVLKGGAGTKAAVVTPKKSESKKPSPAASRSSAPAQATAAPEPAASPTPSRNAPDTVLTSGVDTSNRTLGHRILLVALAVIVVVGGSSALFAARRRRTAQQIHRGNGIR